MEDVLDLYVEPRDPERPVVCFGETSTQLQADAREPLPAKPGRPRREDYEYQRAGTRNLFLSCEPRAGWRHVAITKQRTMQDFAHQMRWLVDEAEDAEYGPEQRGDELPEELRRREGRLEKIREAKRRLEERARGRGQERAEARGLERKR